MHPRTLARLTATLVALFGIGYASDAQGQTRFGAEAAYANDFGLGVGARVVRDIDAFSDNEESLLKQVRLIGELIYYVSPFDGCDACGAWEADINGAIPLDLGSADFYAGAGLNIARVSVDLGIALPGFAYDASATRMGLNLLGGLNFPLGGLGAFAEGGLQLGGGEQFLIKSGVTFGGGGD